MARYNSLYYLNKMTKLGSWTTIDVPTQNEDAALEFLMEEFNKIDGNVRKVLNPHDFGAYASFEIDYPEDVEELASKSEDSDELTDEDVQKLDDWHDKANGVERAYNEKFSDWL